MTHSSPARPPRVPLCRLTEFVSRTSGRSFLTGFLGGAKIVIVADPADEPATGGVMSYTLFAETAPNGLRPAKTRSEPAGAPSSARPATGTAKAPKTNATPPKSATTGPTADPGMSDEIPF